MREQERLFDAIGNVDERLLERSETWGRRERLRDRLAWTAAVAACAAVVALAWMWTWPAQADPAPPEGPPPAVTPELPAPEPPPRLDGEGYHLLAFQTEEAGVSMDWPAFSIWYSDADYYIYQPLGSCFIRPRTQPEGLPASQLEIAHYKDSTLEEAVALRRKHDELCYETVFLVDENTAGRGVGLPENAAPLCLVASDGTDWDDRQSETWFVEDGQGGVFTLSASCFLEAVEGFGARFYDMVCTFQVETDEDAPPWRLAMENAVMDLAEAVFAGDLTGVERLLALEEPVQDVLDQAEGASAAGFSYSVSQMDAGFAAEAAVKFRSGGEEPYRYLELSLFWEEGEWRVSRIGIRE